MPLKARRLLYLFFILAFLAITPMVFLYAAGYKLGSGFSIHKTGMLIITSKQDNLAVTLNNKTRSPLFDSFLPNREKIIYAPIKLKGLLPGEYEVTISKDNHWDWQKRIYIDPGRSVYIEDIHLLKKGLPILAAAGEFNHLSVSPDNRYLFAAGSEIVRIDTRNDLSQTIATGTDYTFENINWSADGKKAIFEDHIIDLSNTSEETDLKVLLGIKSSNYKWHNRKEGLLYYLSDNNLLSYDFSTKSSRLIAKLGLANDYLIKDSTLFYIIPGSRSAEIIEYNMDANTVSAKVELPLAEYEFINKEHHLLNIYDPRHQILHLVDPGIPIKPIRESLSNVSYAYWASGSDLLYISNFEIFIFDLNSQNKRILARLSGKINKAIMHPTWKYVVYATENSLFTIENGGEHGINKLVEINEISKPVLNEKGDAIYFNGRIGNQSGIYKLSL